MTSVGLRPRETSTAAPPPAPAELPPLAIAELATRRNLSVNLTSTSGAVVTVPASEIRDALKNGTMPALESRYGIRFGTVAGQVNPSEMMQALGAAARSAHDTTIDFTARSANATMYDGVDNRAPSGLQQGHATVATDGAFQIGGQVLDAPEMTGWQTFLNILIRIFTLGQVGLSRSTDTQRFNNAGAELAVAGGSGLREQLTGVPRDEGIRLIADRIRTQAGQHHINEGEINGIAAAVYDGAMSVYNAPGMTPAKLDSLQASYYAAGAAGFGGDAGAFVRAHLDGGDATFTADLAAATSPGEVRAALVLGSPEFASLDAEAQVRLSTQLFNAKNSPDSVAALRALADDPSFASLSGPLHRTLLNAIDHAGAAPGTVGAVRTASPALVALNDRPDVQRAAADAFVEASRISDPAARERATAALSTLINSPQFKELPAATQQRMFAAIAAGHSDPDMIAAMPAFVGGPGFRALAEADANNALQAFATARDAASRTAIGALVESPGFAALPTALKQNALTTMSSLTTPERRATLQALVNSRGFQQLPETQRRALLERFATSPELQDAFSGVPAMLDAMNGSGIPGEVRDMALNTLTNSGATRLPAAVTAYTQLLPQLGASRLPTADQRRVMTALENQRFSPEAATALTGLVSDTTFKSMLAAARTDLLTRMAAPRLDAAHFNTYAELGKDDDFSRLTNTQAGNARTILDFVRTESSGFVRDVRIAIGRVPYRDENATYVGHMLGAMQHATDAEAHAFIEHLRSPAFMALSREEKEVSAAGQVALLAASGDPARLAATQTLISNPQFASLPASTRKMLLDGIATSATNPTAMITGLVTMFDSNGFKALPVDQRDDVTTSVLLLDANAARAITAYGTMFSNAQFTSTDAATRGRILTGVIGATEATRAATIDRFTHMMNHAGFQALPQATRTSMLSGLAHYPTATVAANLERMSGVAWFTAMNAADKQRAVRVFAAMSSYVDTGTPQQQAMFRNTLNHMLPPDGVVAFDFQNYQNPPGRITLGSALDRQMHVNRSTVSADDNAFPKNDRIISTVIHEVNHLSNNDRVKPTFRYLMGEYGASYSEGIVSGTPPTRQQCYDRILFFVDSTTGAYANLRSFVQSAPNAEFNSLVNYLNANNMFNPPLANDQASAQRLLNVGTRPASPSSPPAANTAGPGPGGTLPDGTAYVRDMTNATQPPPAGTQAGSNEHAHAPQCGCGSG